MRRFQVLTLAALLGCTLIAQARQSLELANEAVPDGIRIPYGPEALQFGELRLPAGPGPYPVAIVVHGGCWLARFTSMDARAVSMEYMRPLAAALTDAGIATWNVEYRSPVITDLLGGTPEQRPSQYHDGSPIELLPIGVSQEVFAGAMFASQARPYETAAQKTGDTVTTTVLPRAGHFVFVDPRSPDWPKVLAAVRRLVSPAGRQ